MWLAHAGMRLLEFAFFVGFLGSLSVVVFSSVEDIRELSKKDEEPSSTEAGQAARSH